MYILMFLVNNCMHFCMKDRNLLKGIHQYLDYVESHFEVLRCAETTHCTTCGEIYGIVKLSVIVNSTIPNFTPIGFSSSSQSKRLAGKSISVSS